MEAETLKDLRILILDDERSNVELLERILHVHGYRESKGITDSSLFEQVFVEYRPDLVLLDLRMPGTDGFGILELIQRIGAGRGYLPILVLTGDINTETRLKALSLGARDFVTKPFDQAEVLLRIGNLLETRGLHLELDARNRDLEEKVQSRTIDLRDALERLAESERETALAAEETIHRLAAAAEYRDEETGWHIERMSRYAALLTKRLEGDENRAERMRLASLMHDVGKIGIPDGVLRKRGRLLPAEFDIIKRHARIGYEILANSKADLLGLAQTVAWTHHEWWDGGGYPRGLVGKDIPIEGRVAAVADVFDALTSKRVYRPAYPWDRAVEVMNEIRGSHLDAEIVDLLLDSTDEVLEIAARYADPPAGRSPEDSH